MKIHVKLNECTSKWIKDMHVSNVTGISVVINIVINIQVLVVSGIMFTYRTVELSLRKSGMKMDDSLISVQF